MRSTLSSLTVVALLLMQVWVAATRGSVICFSAASLGTRTCAQEHSHHHAGVMLPEEEHQGCEDCLHIATPDDPQQLRGDLDLNQDLLVSIIPAPLDPVLVACQPQTEERVTWSLPPPDPSGSARALALSATELLI